MRPFVPLRACLGALMRDRRGAAAVLLAVALVPLIGAVGLAVDSSVGYLLKTRMSKALDSAGLAAGRVALDGNAEAVAQSFFDANFGTEVGGIDVEDIEFELDETERFITLSAEATAPTYFMRVFGHDTLTVSARTVIERQTTGMELALVLDNTGSMQDDDKFETMEDAAKDLVEILYGDEDVIDNLWVSVVPFITTVNIGTSHKSWIKDTDRVYTSPNSWSSSNNRPWAGCVVARSPSLDVDDTPHSGGKWSSWRWVNNLPGAANGNRNYACPAPITGLTASRDEIDDAIDAMTVGPKASGTATNYGLVWGWRTLSPRWRGLWGGSTPAELPLDYDTDNMKKVAVVLTDGENRMLNGHLTSYGTWADHGFDSEADTTDFLNGKTIEVCEAMKAEEILVFTILFGEGNDEDAQELLEDCATNPAMYYYAEDNEDLAPAFRAIGGQLANLMIVE